MGSVTDSYRAFEWRDFAKASKGAQIHLGNLRRDLHAGY